MNLDIRSWPKDFLSDFISLYRSNPCLWKIKSKDYLNKNLKYNAYELLCCKLKELQPNVTHDDVKKKINSLRSNYRREKKKISDTRKSGSGQENLYQSNLWYFEELNFLSDQEEVRTSTSTLTDIPEEFCDPFISTEVDYDNLERSPPEKRVKMDKCDKILESINSRINEVPIETEFDIVGKNIANKLEQLPPEMSILAEKFINDILFEARMGTLSRAMKLVDGTSSASACTPNAAEFFVNFTE